MARSVVNPLVGTSLAMQELRRLSENINQAGKYRRDIQIAKDKNQTDLDKEILRQQGETVKGWATTEKDLRAGIYGDIEEAVIGGTRQDIDDVMRYFNEDEDGVMYIDKMITSKVPEQNRDLFRTGEELRNLAHTRIQFHNTNIEGMKFFRNSNNPEEERLKEFDRVFNLHQEGKVNAAYMSKYYEIAKSNNMASLGYGKAATVKVTDYRTRFSSASSTIEGWKRDWGGTVEDLHDWGIDNPSLVPPGVLITTDALENKNSVEYKNIYKDYSAKRQQSAMATLRNAIVAGDTRKMFLPVKDGGSNDEYSKSRMFSQIASVAIESIPELADIKDREKLIRTINAEGPTKKKLVKLLDEAFGPGTWQKYLKNEDGYSTIEILR